LQFVRSPLFRQKRCFVKKMLRKKTEPNMTQSNLQSDPQRDPVDRLLIGIDQALRTLTGQYQAKRSNPAAETTDAVLSEAERAHAAGLMRVNHAGEICAQALYEGQALTARSDQARQSLLQAAEEERDHLAWCRSRLSELDAKPSVLDPLFFGASFVMGAITGLAGDKISMGFVEATEDQVVQHLDGHLDDLPEGDKRSRAILEQMRADEAKHGAQALDQGGVEFPPLAKNAMTVVSRLMTETTYRK
jgi:ubiquinone biosynthesis monooxygenase Coq7